MKRATIFGVTLSVIWVIAFSCLLYSKRSTLGDLKINEWGDFFAGAVAPLAFFWLVLGYMQQGEELRLNTDALNAQQTELKLQVQKTAALVEQTSRQAIATEQLANATQTDLMRTAKREILEAAPLLTPNGGMGNGEDLTFLAKNVGANVYKLSITCTDVQSINITPNDVLMHQGLLSINISGIQEYPFTFNFSYKDRLDNENKQTYSVSSPFQYALT